MAKRKSRETLQPSEDVGKTIRGAYEEESSQDVRDSPGADGAPEHQHPHAADEGVRRNRDSTGPQSGSGSADARSGVPPKR